MPKSRSPYPPELRRRLVELVRSGRSLGELAKKFEPSAQSIRNWARQADLDEGRREDGLTTEEREEIQLRLATIPSALSQLELRERPDPAFCACHLWSGSVILGRCCSSSLPSPHWISSPYRR